MIRSRFEVVIMARKASAPVAAERALRRAYEEQLDLIGQVLVRAKIITRRQIRRDGVAFAVRNRFDVPNRKSRPRHA